MHMSTCVYVDLLHINTCNLHDIASHMCMTTCVQGIRASLCAFDAIFRISIILLHVICKLLHMNIDM